MRGSELNLAFSVLIAIGLNNTKFPSRKEKTYINFPSKKESLYICILKKMT